MYIITAKALHSKVIYKAVPLYNLNLDLDLLVRHLNWNEAQRNTKSISLKIP